MTRPLRYLWAYSATDPHRHRWNHRLNEQRQARGYDVETFCVTPPSVERGWLGFPELDQRWRRGDPEILDVHARLEERLRDRDVLVLFNGAHLHPEFVEALDLTTVYHCADDPESSELLSRPMAPAFDLSVVANVACLDLYRSWGVEDVHWLPLGSSVFAADVADLTAADVAAPGRRPVPIFLACERTSVRRANRLDRLVAAFPEALCVGRGWPRGFLPWDELWSTYRRSQLGWNLHNSVGPVNFRTFDLPAHGVLQICDNRSNLGEIFDVGTEVVGFDTADEAIEATRYYLDHQDEQREIALRGWERWRRDYTPEAVWDRLVRIIEDHRSGPGSGSGTGSARLVLARVERRRSVSTVVRHIVPSRIRRRFRRVPVERVRNDR